MRAIDKIEAFFFGLLGGVCVGFWLLALAGRG